MPFGDRKHQAMHMRQPITGMQTPSTMPTMHPVSHPALPSPALMRYVHEAIPDRFRTLVEERVHHLANVHGRFYGGIHDDARRWVLEHMEWPAQWPWLAA